MDRGLLVSEIYGIDSVLLSNWYTFASTSFQKSRGLRTCSEANSRDLRVMQRSGYAQRHGYVILSFWS